MTETPSSPSPRLVLLASLLLPGSGHVWLGLAQRGMIFLFFTLIFGWISVRLMPETASFIGRHIGGVFMWGICALDAYKTARIRAEVSKHDQNIL
jgi:hypothetical protein